ncbi:hypothetical protein ABTW96_29305 [Nocardia beijingensis]|uniref:hypothetical protein n=1 Tax=Nocardia beijingensis TaxID=95162 RepID=UPI00331782F4
MAASSSRTSGNSIHQNSLFWQWMYPNCCVRFAATAARRVRMLGLTSLERRGCGAAGTSVIKRWNKGTRTQWPDAKRYLIAAHAGTPAACAAIEGTGFGAPVRIEG